MTDRRIMSLRLAQAASVAWACLQAEVNRLPDAAEVKQAYLAALALLMSWVMNASEVLTKKPISPEAFDHIIRAWSDEVWERLVRLRGAQEAAQPGPDKKVETGVH